jgi:multiple sugar transport system permease protein
VKRGDHSGRMFALGAVGPTMLVMLALVGGPIAYSLYISFHSWYLTQPSTIGTFTGLSNYAQVLHDDRFWRSARVTLTFVVLTVSLEVVAGMAVAMLINQVRRFQGVLLGLIIIPWAIPNVVNALMWKWILNPYYGALDGALYSLGIIHDYTSFLRFPLAAMIAVANAQVWKQLPLVIFILLAGLQSVPLEFYEASEVDGASAWQRFRYITLPLVRAPLMVVLILQTMESLRVFDIIWVMTGGGPGTSTTVIAWLTYISAFRQFNFGAGAALSFIITILTLGFTAMYIRLLRSDNS